MSDAKAVEITGGGIIEISAVATLIGAPVAEALTVGLKSSAGLPWASISSFGLLHVAKASLAAAIPDWLREPLGLSNANVDLALGQQQALIENKATSRVELGDPVAISVGASSKYAASSRCNCTTRHQSRNTMCVYKNDRYSSLVLTTILESETGQRISIHEFTMDPGHSKNWLKNWTVLLLSTVKIAEVVTLRELGANTLWVFTAVPWVWGFLSGAVLMLVSDKSTDDSKAIDIATGQLPSPLHAGGRAKLVLGLPRNPRRSFSWILMWSVYSMTVITGLIGSYVMLGTNPSRVIYSWIGWQAGFLILRTLIYYLLDNVYGKRHGLARRWEWEQCSPALRKRVLHLLFGLAAYQETTHPRGARSYETDLGCLTRLENRLADQSWQFATHYTPSKGHVPDKIRLLDVVGDNLLRSISWLHGASLPNNELYDCCLAFFAIDAQKFAVPAVRVMACRCARFANGGFPRGDSHGLTCPRMCWFMWVPVSRSDADGGADGRKEGWLFVEAQNMQGEARADYMSDEELELRLGKKEWHISLSSSREFREILRVGREAAGLLVGMVRDAHDRAAGGAKEV